MNSRAALKLAAVFATVGLAAGCSGGGDSDNEATSAGGVAADAPDAAAEEAAEQDTGSEGDDSADGERPSGGMIAEVVTAVDGRDIIYTIDISMEVEDVNRAAREAATIAVANGGFVAQEETASVEEYASLTLKIPVDAQSEAVNQVEQLGDVTHRTRSTRDVTQEVVDVESRVASQRASISRIRALLDRATDIEQIIETEAELAAREADLDALLSRQEELSALTSLATVTVTFHKPDEDLAALDDPEEQGFVVGLRNGWDGFTAFGAVFLTAVGAVLPFAVLAAAIAVPILYVRRARKVAQPATPPPAPPSD